MSETGVIIQARIGSTRLKKKVIRPFYDNKGILEILIDKIKFHLPDIPLILATSTHEDNDILENLAGKKGINCFRGDENDVLNRFICAARQYKIDNLIRICADNPFLDPDALGQLITVAETHRELDYISFKLKDGKPSIKSHQGFFAEFVKLSALEKVKLATTEPHYLEHVTNYIYGTPKSFNIKLLAAPSMVYNRPDIRLTIDSEDDFILARKIVNLLGKGPLEISLWEIIDTIDKHPALIKEMRFRIDANEK